MDVFDASYCRRGVKQCDPNHKLTKQEGKRLFEAAIESLTPFNNQNRRFVAVCGPVPHKPIRPHGSNQP